jgi:chromosome partitioning protein
LNNQSFSNPRSTAAHSLPSIICYFTFVVSLVYENSMAQIISFANQKGGVGKSTATLLAATALSQQPFGYDVAVVDVDRQQSVSKRRAYDLDGFTEPLPFDVLTYNFATFKQQVKTLDARYQIIFLDVPGKLDADAGRDSEAIQALQYIDLVLVPVTPGNFGIDATIDYLKAALAVKATRPDLRLVAFRNMHRTRSRHGKQLAGELDELATLTAVPVMEAPLKRYSEFEDADSLTSLYAPGSSSPARANFSTWLDELHTLITK